MERAYWATTNIGPYVEHQVVVFDDERDPGAGWVRSGWFREILPVPVPLDDAAIERYAAEAERGYDPGKLKAALKRARRR